MNDKQNNSAIGKLGLQICRHKGNLSDFVVLGSYPIKRAKRPVEWRMCASLPRIDVSAPPSPWNYYSRTLWWRLLMFLLLLLPLPTNWLAILLCHKLWISPSLHDISARLWNYYIPLFLWIIFWLEWKDIYYFL